jgi:hypothetical protein
MQYLLCRHNLQDPPHGAHLCPSQVELRLLAGEDVGLSQAGPHLHQTQRPGNLPYFLLFSQFQIRLGGREKCVVVSCHNIFSVTLTVSLVQIRD